MRTPYAASGTVTSMAWGMVLGAAATLAGGSAGSALPLRNTTGEELLTAPDTPGSWGQLAQMARCHWAV